MTTLRPAGAAVCVRLSGQRAAAGCAGVQRRHLPAHRQGAQLHGRRCGFRASVKRCHVPLLPVLVARLAERRTCVLRPKAMPRTAAIDTAQASRSARAPTTWATSCWPICCWRTFRCAAFPLQQELQKQQLQSCSVHPSAEKPLCGHCARRAQRHRHTIAPGRLLNPQPCHRRRSRRRTARTSGSSSWAPSPATPTRSPAMCRPRCPGPPGSKSVCDGTVRHCSAAGCCRWLGCAKHCKPSSSRSSQSRAARGTASSTVRR